MSYGKRTLEESLGTELKQIIVNAACHEPNLTLEKLEFYTWWIWALGLKGL